MNISIKNKYECCGCTACASICPHDAIHMVPDSLGFKYPVVDADKCTECGLCVKTCAFHPDYDTTENLDTPETFGARHKDSEELMSSRSGGVFASIYDWILSQNGVVYGVGFSGHFVVTHKRATTKSQCKEFKGSKYVQSDLDGIFRLAKEDLKSGRIVLFSGTPCQIAGLKSFVGKKYRENLYLVDIICHGVPSPYVWRDYLDYLEKREKKEITSLNFRDKKKFGWAYHMESFCFKDGSHLYEHTYTYTFYKHIMFRQSCAECPYCNLKRPSDLTLGDFWGWEKTDPQFNLDDRGCSLILCNTPKGESLFNKVSNTLDVRTANLKDCMQAHLKNPSSLHPKWMEFEKDYSEYGFGYILNKYCRETRKELLRREVGVAKRAITKFLKRAYYKVK